ncbi:MAG: membrane dipeptidase [Acidobacteriota bacterium]
MVSRRNLMAAGVCTLAGPLLKNRPYSLLAAELPSYSGRTISTRAIDIVRASVVVDMLGLLTLDYRKLCDWQAHPESFPESEFARLKASGVTILHPAVGFVTGDVYESSWNDVARWNRFLAAHAEKFIQVLGPADLLRAKQTGKIGVVLGLQNSGHFRTCDDVDRFYELGQRVSQLTYHNNPLGGGSTGPSTGPASGLTAFGAEVIQRMNGLGMAVDVSHCSDRTTLDAIEASTKPVLVTHSNCRVLVPGSARCKPDEIIRRIAQQGGVFGVTMVRPFVRSSGATTLEHVLDHIDHIARLVGVEHAGLGTDVDMDGRDRTLPLRADLDGMRYSQKIFELAEGLIHRGYSDTDIALILGGNSQRVLGTIWDVASKAR